MIPKVIHYIWFGGKPLTPLAVRCIESWQRYMPDYEIRRWDETNFDVNQSDYIREAFSSRKWAFASDFARFRVLFEYGGVYLDTDVELIKPLDEILERGPFMACERWKGIHPYPRVNTGLGFAAEPQDPLLKSIVDYYLNLHFDGGDTGMDVVGHVTSIMIKNGLVQTDTIQRICGMNIYPTEYFCPFDYMNRLEIKPETVAIHHSAGSWISRKNKVKKIISGILGHRITYYIVETKKYIRSMSAHRK